MAENTGVRWVTLAALVTVLSVLASCGGGSDSSENQFNNGYRLVSTSVDNLFADILDHEDTFDYGVGSGNVIMTRTSFEGGVEEQRTRELNLDSAGRLSAENYTFEATDYQTNYTYDGEGDLVGYDGVTGSQVLRYTDGLLTEISYTRHDRLIVDVKIRLSYDSESRLVSALNMFEGSETLYTYNALNQITSAAEWTISGLEQFTQSFEYDVNGNLKREITTRQFGDVYEVSDYEYELTSEPTYNHTLMRMKLQPFDSIVFSFLSYS